MKVGGQNLWETSQIYLSYHAVWHEVQNILPFDAESNTHQLQGDVEPMQDRF